MKAVIKSDGNLWVISETPAEGIALQALFWKDVCASCGTMPTDHLVIDASIVKGAKLKPTNAEDEPEEG